MSNTEQNLKKLGRFRSISSEKTYKTSYDAAMKLLPSPSRTLDLKTSFGVVRVYEFNGQSETLPIVLLPGRSSGVPMWAKNLPELSKNYTVYALDAIGDAGLSVQTKVLQNATDQATWLEEAFEQLQLSKFHLVGHSFGGWLAANYAVRYPERIQTLGLLEPVFVLQGLRWQVYLQATLAILPFLPRSLRDKMLSGIGGGAKIDRTDAIARMIAEASNSFNTKVPTPTQITQDQLKKLSMPVYVAIGGKSAMHDPAAVAKVAHQEIKNVTLKTWPTGTHSLPMEFTDELNRELLHFIKMHDGVDETELQK